MSAISFQEYQQRLEMEERSPPISISYGEQINQELAKISSYKLSTVSTATGDGRDACTSPPISISYGEQINQELAKISSGPYRTLQMHLTNSLSDQFNVTIPANRGLKLLSHEGAGDEDFAVLRKYSSTSRVMLSYRSKI